MDISSRKLGFEMIKPDFVSKKIRIQLSGLCCMDLTDLRVFKYVYQKWGIEAETTYDMDLTT